jgi:hypothetical protein
LATKPLALATSNERLVITTTIRRSPAPAATGPRATADRPQSLVWFSAGFLRIFSSRWPDPLNFRIQTRPPECAQPSGRFFKVAECLSGTVHARVRRFQAMHREQARLDRPHRPATCRDPELLPMSGAAELLSRSARSTWRECPVTPQAASIWQGLLRAARHPPRDQPLSARLRRRKPPPRASATPSIMPIIELDDTPERPDGVDDGSQRPERVVCSCRAAENTAAKAKKSGSIVARDACCGRHSLAARAARVVSDAAAGVAWRLDEEELTDWRAGRDAVYQTCRADNRRSPRGRPNTSLSLLNPTSISFSERSMPA